jgi:hypothetical protein
VDGSRFDALARTLVAARSRRALLKKVLAGGTVLATLGRREPAAAARPKPVGARCHADAQCATNLCERTTRQCIASCAQEGSCASPGLCGPGCGCYCDPFVSNPDGSVRSFCLQDPPDPPTCAGSPVCFSHAECPRGTFCSASSCCGADSVCLPLCSPA